MENPLKPQPLMAEVLPGFTTILILASAYCVAHPGTLSAVSSDKNTATIIGGGFFTILASWIVGTLLDAIRDLFEQVFDRLRPVNWKFLFSAAPDDIQKLENSWLAYYFLNGNMAVGIFLAAILGLLISAVRMPLEWLVLIIPTIVVYSWNFWTLREEIRELVENVPETPTAGELPHERAYARVALSNAPPTEQFANSPAGVGVIAIRDIPKDTLVFFPDNDEIALIEAAKVDALDPELRKLYVDFCPLNNGFYTCPTNFNKMTTAWYVNDSETPNIEADKSLRFRALHDIKAGEELVSRYSGYSE